MFSVLWQSFIHLAWAGSLYLQVGRLDISSLTPQMESPWVRIQNATQLEPGQLVLLHLFSTFSSERVRQILIGHQAQILGYLPEDTWMLRLPLQAEQVRALTQHFEQNAVFLQMLPLAKISPDFGVTHVFNAKELVDARLVLWSAQDLPQLRQWISARVEVSASGKYVDLRRLTR